jgi:hypothetical protein
MTDRRPNGTPPVAAPQAAATLDPTVTYSPRAGKRNAGVRERPDARPLLTFKGGEVLFEIKCPGCPAGLDYIDRNGRVNRSFRRHCTTCHGRDHNACESCGKCLTESVRRLDRYQGRIYGSHETDPRTDRAYCGPACRQRAYRARKAATA